MQNRPNPQNNYPTPTHQAMASVNVSQVFGLFHESYQAIIRTANQGINLSNEKVSRFFDKKL